jgi:hypothetical protein
MGESSSHRQRVDAVAKTNAGAEKCEGAGKQCSGNDGILWAEHGGHKSRTGPQPVAAVLGFCVAGGESEGHEDCFSVS